jgi:hypothetical protein
MSAIPVARETRDSQAGLVKPEAAVGPPPARSSVFEACGHIVAIEASLREGTGSACLCCH